MTAQRYTHPVPLRRLHEGTCPECGNLEEDHDPPVEFWKRMPGTCNLLPIGVRERIAQFNKDMQPAEEGTNAPAS